MQGEAQRIGAMLRQMATTECSVATIADSAVSLWHDVATALSPIIGQQGVAALYNRSLHLVAATHPWLKTAQEDSTRIPTFELLHRTLLLQAPRHAATAAADLFTTFNQILASLIGASLTERLLKPVWASSSNGQTVQDSNVS